MYLVIDEDGNATYTKEIGLEHEEGWENGAYNFYRLHEGKYQEYQGTGKWRDVPELEPLSEEDEDEDEDDDWLEDEDEEDDE